MARPQLREDQWRRLYAVLQAQPGIYVRQEVATRHFVEAVLWMARAGCAWRLVPGGFRCVERGAQRPGLSGIPCADHGLLILGSGELEAVLEQDRELGPGHAHPLGGILHSRSARFKTR